MIHPIPPGTRDVLPDEMRELRELTGTLHGAFERAGYGEVWTPTMEYEEVLRTGDERAAGAGYRLFDEHGQVLVLRSDMTIPIARLVSSRYSERDVPIRLCYFAHAYREVDRRSGQAREFLQGGIELIGLPEPHGDAEVVSLVIVALTEAGLRRHRLGLGDGSLYPTLLAELEVEEAERAAAARGARAARHGRGRAAGRSPGPRQGRERAARHAAKPAGRPRGAGARP